jgi:amidohydrolase
LVHSPLEEEIGLTDSAHETAPEALKNQICDWIDSQRADLLRVSHAIHANPELAFEEHEACRVLVEALRKAGLNVETGSGGLETAFSTNFGNDSGPCVALLAEYDALPEIGHACGHNLIATAAVGAGLALANIAAELPGRVRVLGTPAEEKGGGKAIMMKAGAFAGVDCALMIHPAGFNIGAMPCICKTDVNVVYHGRAAHASAAPERGINALDALVLAYQSVAALRQHIRPDERIHGIITDGGKAANIVPETAAATFYVRSPRQKGLARLRERVHACFEAGAQATGATLEIEWSDVDYLDLRSSAPLEDSFRANAERLGREFIPDDALPPMMAGSTDMGNVSHEFPSIHPMIAAAPINVSIHNREFADYAGGEMGDLAALDGAKSLAMTALDYLYSPTLQERTRNVFEHS